MYKYSTYLFQVCASECKRVECMQSECVIKMLFKNITHELMDRMHHINFKVYTATVIVVLQSKLTLAARVFF